MKGSYQIPKIISDDRTALSHLSRWRSRGRRPNIPEQLFLAYIYVQDAENLTPTYYGNEWGEIFIETRPCVCR